MSRSNFPHSKFTSILCLLIFVAALAFVASQKDQARSKQTLILRIASCAFTSRPRLVMPFRASNIGLFSPVRKMRANAVFCHSALGGAAQLAGALPPGSF